MDIDRIFSEVNQAGLNFAFVETRPTVSGEVYVKAALHTSVGSTYIVAIYFPNYPYQMPEVHVTKPALSSSSPHRYKGGSICYLHPNMWNPGRHNLTFVLGRIAKWLNKYDVWRRNDYWPGASLGH